MRAASSSGSFEPVPSPAVSPQGPVPIVQPVRGGPGGPVADTQHLFVIPQGPRTNAETFEPDNTMTLRDRGPLALELAREGELVPWTRDAIHRVAERPDKQAGGEPRCALGCEVHAPKRMLAIPPLSPDPKVVGERGGQSLS
jgi:hypothetical protein